MKFLTISIDDEGKVKIETHEVGFIEILGLIYAAEAILRLKLLEQHKKEQKEAADGGEAFK